MTLSVCVLGRGVVFPHCKDTLPVLSHVSSRCLWRKHLKLTLGKAKNYTQCINGAKHASLLSVLGSQQNFTRESGRSACERSPSMNSAEGILSLLQMLAFPRRQPFCTEDAASGHCQRHLEEPQQRGLLCSVGELRLLPGFHTSPGTSVTTALNFCGWPSPPQSRLLSFCPQSLYIGLRS